MISTSTIIRNVCLSLSLLSVPAVWADQVKVGDFYYELTDSTKTATLARNAEYKSMTEINVPGKIEVEGVAYTVTEIAQQAFQECTMTKLTVGEGVTTMGKWSVWKCESLTDVTLPSTLITVMPYAFAYCNSIKVLVLPDNLTTISTKAFTPMDALTEVTLPANLTTLGDNVFDSCTKLTKVNFGKSLTTIDGQAFRMCGFVTITLPESLKVLDSGAFSKCSNLTTVNFPEGLVELGAQVFYECSNLTGVVLPESLKKIGNAAFYNCKAIESINFPASVETAEDNCFYGCAKLNNVKWPSKLTSIPNNAFYQCAGLTNIEIPETVTSIGTSAFRQCSSLSAIKLPNGLTEISQNCFSYCTSLKQIDIPTNVTRICNNAFYQSGLESLYISANVDSIGRVTVLGCTNLPAIDVDPSNPYYTSVDGALYDKQVTHLIAYPAGKKGEYVMPETVTSIDDSSCQQSPNITGIKFSKNLKKIGNSVFFSCSKLTEIDLPESLESIGATVFFYCSGITSIKFPNRQVLIGNNALAATGVKTLLIPETNTTIGIDAAGTGASIMASCQSLEWISMPSTLVKFRPFASGCNNLKTIYSFAPVPAEFALTATELDGSTSMPTVTMEMTIKVPKGTAAAYEAAWKKIYTNAKFEDVLPNGLIATMQNGTATLNWEAYSDDVYTGTPVNYVVTLNDGNGNVLTQTLDGDKISGNNLTVSFTELTGTAYTYEVKGYSSIGQLTVYHTGELNATTTGIDDVDADDTVVSEVYYDLNGRVVVSPVAGNIYVIKKTFANGSTTVAKVLVK